MLDVLLGIGLGLLFIAAVCGLAFCWDGVIYTSTTTETHRHVPVGTLMMADSAEGRK